MTYAAKLDAGRPRDRLGRGRPTTIDRVVRVGGAWTTFRGRRLKVLDAGAGRRGRPTGGADGPAPGTLIGDEVATGSGRLRLLTVQPEGKPAMAAAAWRHGAHPGPADRLGA